MKLYGAPYTRAGRCVWMLEELGVAYQNVPVNPRTGETHTSEMLARNPNGHVPVLDDDGYIIWESLAINLYLAEKYATLWPAGVHGHGRAVQWSLWAMTEVEPPLIALLMHSMFLPEAQRDPNAAAKGAEELKKPVQVLNQQLGGQPYLLGSEFTVADLNVCAVLGMAAFVSYDFSPYPHVAAWLERCNGRPAARKYQELIRQSLGR